MMTLTDANIKPFNLGPIVGPEKPPKPAVHTAWPLKLARIYFNVAARIMPNIAADQALELFSKPQTRYRARKYDDLLASSQPFQVVSNGNKIQGHIWDNTGASVLLVHGWESGGLHLGSFIEPLWSEGYRVITFDGPAHGSSEGTHTNLLEFADAIDAIRNQVADIDHIVSHSFGGIASIYMASLAGAKAPLKSMVLISVPNKLTRVIDEFANFLKLPKSLVKRMNKKIKTYYGVDTRNVESAKLGKSMVVDRVLVIHDRHDAVLPFYNSLEITHELSNARLLETEHLGHNRILKNQQVIERIVQFIKMSGPWER